MTKRHLFVGALLGVAGMVLAASGVQAEPAPTVDMESEAITAEPMACSGTLAQGGPTSCKSKDLWYSYAKQDCAAQGYTSIGSISYVESCGTGLYRYVKYTCC